VSTAGFAERRRAAGRWFSIFTLSASDDVAFVGGPMTERREKGGEGREEKCVQS
jgi:hypothetical protein